MYTEEYICKLVFFQHPPPTSEDAEVDSLNISLLEVATNVQINKRRLIFLSPPPTHPLEVGFQFTK